MPTDNRTWRMVVVNDPRTYTTQQVLDYITDELNPERINSGDADDCTPYALPLVVGESEISDANGEEIAVIA